MARTKMTRAKPQKNYKKMFKTKNGQNQTCQNQNAKKLNAQIKTKLANMKNGQNQTVPDQNGSAKMA